MKNKYEKLTIKDFVDEYSLVEEMVDTLFSMDTDKYYCVSVYAKAEFINRIFKLLVENYDFEIGSLDFARSYYDDEYSAEYYIGLTDEKMIIIDKAYNSDFKPYNSFGEIAYMYQEDCEQELLDTLLDNDVKPILFGVGVNEDDFDDDCAWYELETKNELDSDKSEYTHISRNKDGTIIGVMKSWSDTENGVSHYSSYSYCSTDEDALKKVAEDLGINL